MKKIKKCSLLIIAILLILTFSCKTKENKQNDDSPVPNNPDIIKDEAVLDSVADIKVENYQCNIEVDEQNAKYDLQHNLHFSKETRYKITSDIEGNDEIDDKDVDLTKEVNKYYLFVENDNKPYEITIKKVKYCLINFTTNVNLADKSLSVAVGTSVDERKLKLFMHLDNDIDKVYLNDKEVSFPFVIEDDCHIHIEFKETNLVRYRIDYYLEKDNQPGEYLLNYSDIQLAIPDSDVIIKPKKILGYTALTDNVLSQKILSDGSTVFSLYYKKNHFKISYVLDGGTFVYPDQVRYEHDGRVMFSLPPLKRDNDVFLGYYIDDNKERIYQNLPIGIEKDIILTAVYKIVEPENTCKWEIDNHDFNGDGNKFVIKVSSLATYDPFYIYYTGADKEQKMKLINHLKNLYNLDIVFEQYNKTDESYGPKRIDYIKNGIEDGTLQNNGINLLEINSAWLRSILFDKNNNSLNNLVPILSDNGLSGLADKLNYNEEKVQFNDLINPLIKQYSLTYGYSVDVPRADKYLIYSYAFINEYGLEDPGELWLKGEWTIGKFKEYIDNAYSIIKKDNNKILAGEPALLIPGFVYGRGGTIANASTGRVMLKSKYVADTVTELRNYLNNGYYARYSVNEEVASSFDQNHILFNSILLYYLKNNEKLENMRNIGLVPYPMADEYKETLEYHYSPYSYVTVNGQEKYVGETLKNQYGEEILINQKPLYGITYNKYRIPYGSNTCFVIPKYNDSTIPSIISFEILHALFKGIDTSNSDFNVEERYLANYSYKLSPVGLEVLRSCQDRNLLCMDDYEKYSIYFGNGSHYGAGGWWNIAKHLLFDTGEVSDILNKYFDMWTLPTTPDTY